MAISGDINFRTGCTVTPVPAAVCAAHQTSSSHTPSQYLVLSVDERTVLHILYIPGNIRRDKLPDRMYCDSCTCCCLCCLPTSSPPSKYLVLSVDERTVLYICIPGNILRDKLPDRMYCDSGTCCCLCFLPTSSPPSKYLVLSVDEGTVLYIYLAIYGEINLRTGCTVTPVLALSVLPTTHLPLHFRFSTHQIEYIPLVKIREHLVGFSSDKEPQIIIEYMSLCSCIS
jgi:hypothetical protein